MKIAKRVLIALVVYVGIVAAFESMIGFLQPQDQSTLVIITTDGDGNSNDRVLAHLESDGKIFVAANHWPRAWYAQALENPDFKIDPPLYIFASPDSVVLVEKIGDPIAANVFFFDEQGLVKRSIVHEQAVSPLP